MPINYPQVVQFETTTACNAHCGFCPHSSMERAGRMADGLIAKILDEIAAWPVKPTSICPFLTNEPFADPRIFDISSRIREVAPAAELTFFTNASLLNKARRDAILAIPGTTKFFCSLHHSAEEAYKAELGLDFDRTVDNICHLIKDAPPANVIVLRVSDGNHRKDKLFKEFVRGYMGGTPMISTRWNWKGDIASHQRDLFPNIICPRGTSLTILHDGRVSLCCMDQAGQYPRGDINHQTLLEVFNGAAHAHFFATPKSAKSPCQNCNMH
jgi:MoaA/NifB/PqqE/SkfB family radical SAM enzyme